MRMWMEQFCDEHQPKCSEADVWRSRPNSLLVVVHEKTCCHHSELPLTPVTPEQVPSADRITRVRVLFYLFARVLAVLLRFLRNLSVLTHMHDKLTFTSNGRVF